MTANTGAGRMFSVVYITLDLIGFMSVLLLIDVVRRLWTSGKGRSQTAALVPPSDSSVGAKDSEKGVKTRLPVMIAAPAVFLLISCGGDSPGAGSSLTDTDLLKLTLANMNQLPSVSGIVTSDVDSAGITVTFKQEFSYEAPDKTYVVTTVLGQKTEVFFDGKSVYVREARGSWREAPLFALGIGMDRFNSVTEIADLATEVEVMPEVKENGEDLAHLRVELAGGELGQEFRDFYLTSGIRRLNLRHIEVDSVQVDYFILADDLLLRRGSMTLFFRSQGKDFEVQVEFSYAAFGEPASLPEDIPVGTLAGNDGLAGD